MSDETTAGPDLRERIEQIVETRWPLDLDIRGLADAIREAVDALMAVVQPELDQALVDLETAKEWRDAALAERDAARTEAAEYRIANTRLQELITLRTEERDQLKAAVGPIALLDEACGSTEPASGRLTCTLLARHDVHYAAGSGTAWRCLCGPTDAEAAVARVKALAEDMRTWCSPHGIAVTYAQRIDEAIEPPAPVGIEADSEAEFAAKLGAIMRKHRAEAHPEHDETCANCAVIKGAPEILTAGLDDLPAVREFAANHDPRRETP